MIREIVAEIRVLKTTSRRPRWRWDVTWQELTDGKYPGVRDARGHLRTECGYAWTKWGAWRAVRLNYDQPPYGTVQR